MGSLTNAIVHTELHGQRLERVIAWLRGHDARTVMDLGCGRGVLLGRLLAESAFTRLVGVDLSAEALAIARQRVLPGQTGQRVELLNASFTDPSLPLSGLDAGVMLETLEHLEPGRLSELEKAVFGIYRPGLMIITTPNAEYNPHFGLAPGEFRDPEHYFEWDRNRFRRWCGRVAQRNGYAVRYQGIGDQDPETGSPTQAALFLRR